MMRHLLAAALITVVAMITPQVVLAQSNESSIRYDQENEKEIRKVYNAFEDAWNEHKVDTMADMWALDGDHQEPDGRHAKGREEVRALFHKQHETVFKNTFLDLSIDAVWFIEANIALVDGSYSLAGVVAPDGTEIPVRKGHLTAILLKETKQWWIIASRLMIPTTLPYKKE